MSWLLDLAYLALLTAVSPVLLWRMVRHGKYRTGWSEKLLGRLSVREGAAPCLWFHAVSVGEVLQLEPVLTELRRKLPSVELVISTTTPTGLSVAKAKFPRDRVCYFPLDFSWAVREAMRRVRPTAIVLVELELWPNFVLHAHRRGIPLALINGRVSEGSSRGYARIRPLMARWLGCFEILAAQNALYADRLAALGAPRDRLRVTGSIKFDRVTTDRGNPQTTELRQCFGIDRSERVFIAGSTQQPEEAAALDAYVSLSRTYPELRLIVVPRHKERFEEVDRLIESRGLPLIRRSQARATAATASPDSPLWHGLPTVPPRRPQVSASDAQHELQPVLLLDTLGELSACWGLADVAFVGGSLTNRGGQNMIEPAGYGAALLFGPNTQNFRDVVEMLLAEDAARVVHDAADLAAVLADCLANPVRAQAQGARAQKLVLAQQGATARTVELLAGLSCFARLADSRAA
jgi:3-deoxy-D-manno-octulosonic-acid transferase